MCKKRSVAGLLLGVTSDAEKGRHAMGNMPYRVAEVSYLAFGPVAKPFRQKICSTIPDLRLRPHGAWPRVCVPREVFVLRW